MPGPEIEPIAEATAALIDGTYLREALKGRRPTAPAAAVALVERQIDLAIAASRP